MSDPGEVTQDALPKKNVSTSGEGDMTPADTMRAGAFLVAGILCVASTAMSQDAPPGNSIDRQQITAIVDRWEKA
jgi:hypothetical protein